jgi:hypothetical protein
METLPNIADWDMMDHMVAVEPSALKMPAEIQTQSGSYFNFLHPELSEFTIEDIACALSKLCRFTGHTRVFYSVAQHSVMVSNLVPPQDALAGLLHDASEAFLNDINSPLKQLLTQYKEIEKRVESVIMRNFGLPETLPTSVKTADLIMLATEKRDLMPGCIDSHWEIIRGVEPMSAVVNPLVPERAYTEFMDRYREIISNTETPLYLYVSNPHPSMARPSLVDYSDSH